MMYLGPPRPSLSSLKAETHSGLTESLDSEGRSENGTIRRGGSHDEKDLQHTQKQAKEGLAGETGETRETREGSYHGCGRTRSLCK